MGPDGSFPRPLFLGSARSASHSSRSIVYTASMTSSPEVDPRNIQLDYAVDAQPRPRTSRNLLLVTSGRVALLGAWFAATMLIARVLGPAAFGLYTLCQNAIRIVTNCVGDPLDMAVMREAPIHLRAGNRAQALDVIRSAFTIRTGLGVLSILITAAVPWAISWVVFGDVDHRRLALLTAAGILGDLLLRHSGVRPPVCCRSQGVLYRLDD